ncbi:glucuronate isomerase [Planctomycetales bacterium ZRK34]|nr:glucuronate isomerase [Planctomycetales bacterium ZRK34]
MSLTTTPDLATQIADAIDGQSIVDMHTHLYPPSFGTPSAPTGADANGLMLYGINELLTYHYLVAELFRVVSPSEVSVADFWAMDKTAQADLIWHKLFLDRSPISEAARGVLTTLQKLGLDPGDRDLAGYRRWFDEQDPDKHIDRVMELSHVESITMTNAVFDDNERQRWLDNPAVGDDPRFTAVLRFDPLLCDWPAAAAKLAEWGYDVKVDIDDKTVTEVRRFLGEWLDRTKSIYAAVSLGPDYRYGEGRHGSAKWADGNRILTQAVLPACAERNLPFAMMIGSARGVNPALRDAGDMGFVADVPSVTELCRDFPDNKFFVTMLSRENQHELAVAARKFGNLMVFGCWWFLNNPSLIEQITRLRVELLGVSFIPQHSDCRVLEQLIYKWDHSRTVIAKVLTDKYADIAATGWRIGEDELARDVKLYLRDNFLNFLKR